MFSQKPRLAGGVDVINEVDNSKFPLLINKIAQVSISKKNFDSPEDIFNEQDLEKLQSSLELDKNLLNTLIESINFVLQQAVYHVAKPNEVKEQLISEGLTEEKAITFAQVWNNISKPTINAFKQETLAPLQLEDIKWSLLTRVSSSSQTGQSEPLANLQLEVFNKDKCDKETIDLELNHATLSNLYNELEKIQGHLDSLK